MDDLYLREPTIEDKVNAECFVEEFHKAGETLVPGGSGIQTMAYEEWLEKVRNMTNEETVPADHVPADTLFSVRKPDNRIVGIVNIRRRLNEQLLHAGGHIGYAIRPSERRKGYGSAQLRLALDRCAKLGIERALVTCDNENAASAATILSQGGIEAERYDIQRRFWVPTEK